jgi:cytochrome b561
LLALSLGVTGYLMISSPIGERLEDLHEVLANAFLVVVLLHLAGIVLHTVKHKDPIAKSVISGYKHHVPETEQSVHSHTVSGLVVLALTLWVGLYLVGNYDPDTRTLSLSGYPLTLAEFDSEMPHGGYDDHDEDDD